MLGYASFIHIKWHYGRCHCGKFLYKTGNRRSCKLHGVQSFDKETLEQELAFDPCIDLLNHFHKIWKLISRLGKK